MGEMKYSGICLLTGKRCDNSCELWDDCPIEEHDISDIKFIAGVIKYLKRKIDEKSSS